MNWVKTNFSKGFVCGVLLLCFFFIQLFPQTLQYDRALVINGEYWRLWTSHLVHGNAIHLLLNFAATLLLALLLFIQFRLCDLVIVSLILMPVISLALLLFYSDLAWYNGLSGLLHALISYCCVRMVLEGKNYYSLGLAAVLFKVFAEFYGLKINYSSSIDGMLVISEAHLIGAVLGVTFGTVVGMFKIFLNNTKKLLTLNTKH